MSKTKSKHMPVLLNEIIETLDVQTGEIVIDATLGGGGHALKIIEKLDGKGVFFGFDVDRKAIENFGERLMDLDFKIGKSQDNNIESYVKGGLNVYLLNSNFRNVDSVNEILTEKEKVTKIYADLGFSTDQLEENLSFRSEGVLDMRMDENLQVKAKDLVNGMYKGELISMFETNSDERLARPIANEIIYRRNKKPIETKKEMTDLITYVVEKYKIPEKDRSYTPEARIFQSLRIAVNDEFGALREFTEKSFQLLDEKGRMGIVSFHSGEDRIVKKAFQALVKEEKAEWVEKLVVPSKKEINRNFKSRSAKLRVISKV